MVRAVRTEASEQTEEEARVVRAVWTEAEPEEPGVKAEVALVIAEVQLARLVSLSSDWRYAPQVVLMPAGVVCESC